MLESLVEAFRGIGTPMETVVEIFHELSARYQAEPNLFCDDDTELKEVVLREALDLVALKNGDINKMSKNEINTIEKAWDRLFKYLEDADGGFNTLDELFEYLNPTSFAIPPSDEEYPDLRSEVESPDVVPERLGELATGMIDWFNDYEEIDVKVVIAQNPKTPQAALEKLAEHNHYEVRLKVASNPSSNRQTIEKLQNDLEPIVQEAARKRMN